MGHVDGTFGAATYLFFPDLCYVYKGVHLSITDKALHLFCFFFYLFPFIKKRLKNYPQTILHIVYGFIQVNVKV